MKEKRRENLSPRNFEARVVHGWTYTPRQKNLLVVAGAVAVAVATRRRPFHHSSFPIQYLLSYH
jgi:hypothetical protein